MHALSRGKHLTQYHMKKSRHVHFMHFTRENILAYCVRILVYELKDRAMIRDKDNAMGHILVLLQYLYPNEMDIYNEVIHR